MHYAGAILECFLCLKSPERNPDPSKHSKTAKIKERGVTVILETISNLKIFGWNPTPSNLAPSNQC